MNRLPVFDRRRAGILLHPTSLPSRDFGDAWRFIDFLSGTGTGVWQMLPLGPTHAEHSPYHCRSMHAVSPELLSAHRLQDGGWIESTETAREQQIEQAFATLQRPDRSAQRMAFEAFCAEHAHWLEDYALYEALRDLHGSRPWWQWPKPVRDRQVPSLEKAAGRLGHVLNRIRLEQYLVFQQLNDLRDYAHARGVRLFGDIPIFVAHDSADVWSHREYFKLDRDGQPRFVAGVPPDYFSATGQRWGNPVYDWTRMEQDGFRWWQERFATELGRSDLLRIDHFRGFESCWEIPAAEPTAINGRWVPVPGQALFTELRHRMGELPLVAEDLGIITTEVTSLRRQHGFPGMLVLQFAFDGGTDNPYLPHNHVAEAVVYTGTHDNDTTLSWFEELGDEARRTVLEYLGTAEPMPRALVHAALNSVALLAVVPMQDVLGLGQGNRMNTPGTPTGNWKWGFDWSQLTVEVQDWWSRALRLSGRVEDRPG